MAENKTLKLISFKLVLNLQEESKRLIIIYLCKRLKSKYGQESKNKGSYNLRIHRLAFNLQGIR